MECNDTYWIVNTNYLSTLLISILHVFNSTNTLPLGICVFEQFEKLKFYYRRGNNSKVEVSVSDINGWRPPFPYSSDENSLEICCLTASTRILFPVIKYSVERYVYVKGNCLQLLCSECGPSSVHYIILCS